MFGLPAGLAARDRPVRVGVIGAGQFGTKCLDQLERVSGLAACAVADAAPERAESARTEAGIPDDAVERVDTADDADRVIAAGGCALLADGDALARADLNVVVEATGDPNEGARHAYGALQAGTHVVMATVEADATVGPFLAGVAASNGVVYSTAYGDQPALIAELVAWARTAGLDVVAAGRGIGSYDANAAIELCAAANATGLPPDPTGLQAPTVSVGDLPDRLRPERDGGVLSETGVVEGAVSPADEDRAPGESIADGVFVVVTTPNGDARTFIRAKNRAGAYVSGDGTHLAFVRPHHLPGSETPVSVARAAVHGHHTGTPDTHVADVTASADEPLPVGTAIGIDYPSTDAPITAELDPAGRAAAGAYVPFALLDGATLVRRVDAGDRITYDDVEIEPSFLWHARALMDA